MLKNLCLCILLIVFVCANSFSQQIETNFLGSFPFTFTSKNNIAVQAILNKKDTVSLMLHTAAESITLIKDSATKSN